MGRRPPVFAVQTYPTEGPTERGTRLPVPEQETARTLLLAHLSNPFVVRAQDIYLREGVREHGREVVVRYVRGHHVICQVPW